MKQHVTLLLLTESQPVGRGVAEVGDHLSQHLYHEADLAVQEEQGVVTKGKHVEVPGQVTANISSVIIKIINLISLLITEVLETRDWPDQKTL